GLSEPLAQRDEAFYGSARFSRVGLRRKPALVLLGVALSGRDAIYTNAERGQGRGPFPGESVDTPFGRGITRCAALACDRNFGTDVDDASSGSFQRIESEMSQRENVKEIALEGGHKIGGRMFQADTIVHPGVVDQNVEMS